MVFIPAAYQKCSPGTRLSDGTCFVREELLCIVGAAEDLLGMNSFSGMDMEEMSNEEILLQLDKFMSWNAESSTAWLEDRKLVRKIIQTCPKLADTILYYRMRPSYAGNRLDKAISSGWTSNFQLDKVMRQFLLALENENKPLVYAGSFNNKPMQWLCNNEYACASPLATHFNDPRNAKVPWAAILNTTEAGTHWVAIYRESATSPLEYFDSFGKPIPRSLKRAIGWLTTEVHDCSGIIQSRRVHQKDDFSCGPFSVYYIVARRRFRSADWFANNTVTIEMIDRFRASLFDADPATFVRKRD